MNVRVLDDPALEVARLLDAAAHAGGHVVLTGGSTPAAAYERCGGDWSRATVWFGDERCVDPGDERSNFALARASLLSHVAPGTVQRIEGERGPEAGAADYEERLRAALGDVPAFDLLLLGLGSDAHVASLFPGRPELSEEDRLVVGVPEAGLEPFVPRVTLTLPVINAARRIVVLVTGEGKADAVARAFGGGPRPSVPGSMLREPLVLLDPAAAAGLP